VTALEPKDAGHLRLERGSSLIVLPQWVWCKRRQGASIVSAAWDDAADDGLNEMRDRPKKDKSRKITTWVKPQLKQDLERVAQKEGRSLSNLLRMAAERIVDEHGAPTITPEQITENTRRFLESMSRRKRLK
jgi:hypothetical protein